MSGKLVRRLKEALSGTAGFEVPWTPPAGYEVAGVIGGTVRDGTVYPTRREANRNSAVVILRDPSGVIEARDLDVEQTPNLRGIAPAVTVRAGVPLWVDAASIHPEALYGVSFGDTPSELRMGVGGDSIVFAPTLAAPLGSYTAAVEFGITGGIRYDLPVSIAAAPAAELFPPETAAGTAKTSHTVAGVSVTAGDLVVVACLAREGTAGDPAGPPALSIGSTLPGAPAWQSASVSATTGNRHTLAVFWATAPQTGAGDVTVTANINCTRWRLLGVKAPGATVVDSAAAADASVLLPNGPPSGFVLGFAGTNGGDNAVTVPGLWEILTTSPADGVGSTLRCAIGLDQLFSWTGPGGPLTVVIALEP